MLHRLLLVSLLSCLSSVACSKDEPTKTDDQSSAEEKSGKSEKKAKDKDSDKDKDKDKGGDDEKKQADGDEKKKTPEPPAGSDDTKGRNAKIAEGTPVPPGCAPDPSGPLGKKPKLVASAGQPGASLAIWQDPDDTGKLKAAITISADGKCYVDYLKQEVSPGSVGGPTGFTFEKGAIQAVTGETDKGATFVGFKVTYETGYAYTEIQAQTYARFYGYVAAGGMPYSCAKIAGEKGDRCAMYHKPIEVQTSGTCRDMKGGGPPPIDVKKIPPGVLKVPVPPSSASIVPPPSASASASATPGAKCDGTPSCTTVAAMTKDANHVYVRVTAGKPEACKGEGDMKVGDTWYFDESKWKKR